MPLNSLQLLLLLLQLGDPLFVGCDPPEQIPIHCLFIEVFED